MFGHQDDQYNQNDTSTDNLMPEPPHDGFLGDDPQATTSTSDSNGATPPANDGFNPALPPTDTPPPAVSPADNTTPVSLDEPAATPSDTPDAGHTNSLLDIKQQALQQLSPLVGHLEQTPEEKFRTTMMMIQASDDQSLVKTAYEAAQAITDEKAKAQALLDIVNEINYFTHQASGEE